MALASGSGRVYKVQVGDQEWFIKEYGALLGGVDERCWLAYAGRKGVTFAVTARATVDHAAAVGQILASLVLR